MHNAPLSPGHPQTRQDSIDSTTAAARHAAQDIVTRPKAATTIIAIPVPQQPPVHTQYPPPLNAPVVVAPLFGSPGSAAAAGKVVVPDLSNVSAKEAERRLSALGLTLTIAEKGKAGFEDVIASQDTRAGSTVAAGSRITAHLRAIGLRAQSLPNGVHLEAPSQGSQPNASVLAGPHAAPSRPLAQQGSALPGLRDTPRASINGQPGATATAPPPAPALGGAAGALAGSRPGIPADGSAQGSVAPPAAGAQSAPQSVVIAPPSAVQASPPPQPAGPPESVQQEPGIAFQPPDDQGLPPDTPPLTDDSSTAVAQADASGWPTGAEASPAPAPTPQPTPAPALASPPSSAAFPTVAGPGAAARSSAATGSEATIAPAPQTGALTASGTSPGTSGEPQGSGANVTGAAPGPASAIPSPAGGAQRDVPPAARQEAPFASIDEALAAMRSATAVFNVPSDVDVDEDCPCRIDFKLDATRSAAALENLIRQDDPAATNFHRSTVKISRKMKAALKAEPNDFIIESATPETQWVSATQPTTWTWMVKPRSWGRHSLHLTLDAEVTLNGETHPRTIRTFDETVNVTVTPMSLIERFIDNNWKWLWAALLIPVAQYLIKQRKRRRVLPVPPAHRAPAGIAKRAKDRK